MNLNDEIVESTDAIMIAQNILTNMVCWKKSLIGIDGRDNSGKSTLARYLSWRLEMPCIHLDLFISRKQMGDDKSYSNLKYDYYANQIIQNRLKNNQPIIIDSILLLKYLQGIPLKCDIMIYVEKFENNKPYLGTSQQQAAFTNYEETFEPKESASYHYKWDVPEN